MIEFAIEPLVGVGPIRLGSSRAQYESIRRPLPNRTTIVISRQSAYLAQGCLAVTSFESAPEPARSLSDELMVAGGAEIYRLSLPYATKIHLTTLRQDFAGDATFPEISTEFSMTTSEAIDALVPYTHALYERMDEPESGHREQHASASSCS